MNAISVFDIPAFFVNNETCLSSPLGVEMGLIKDHQIRGNCRYNSTTAALFGRLAGPGAWCGEKAGLSNLRVDLTVLHYICAVATQGFYEQGYFVTKYALLLRKDGQGTLYEDPNEIKVSNISL